MSEEVAGSSDVRRRTLIGFAAFLERIQVGVEGVGDRAGGLPPREHPAEIEDRALLAFIPDVAFDTTPTRRLDLLYASVRFQVGIFSP